MLSRAVAPRAVVHNPEHIEVRSNHGAQVFAVHLSNFALLDVKDGREKLLEHFAERRRVGPCPDYLKVPVVITGYIDNAFGRDDGVSREFGVIVESLTTHT